MTGPPLNPEQREAVEHGEGPLLILAGAGSGKTRVLTSRVARLIADGLEPDRILAVTFTNKAAGEMRERIEGLIGGPARGLWVGTFHSIAARLLRREAPFTSRDRSFTIYDEDDAVRALKEVMQSAGHDPKRWSPRAVRGRISSAKSALVGPADYSATAFDLLSKVVAEVYPGYQRILERRNAYDFDDLLSEAVRLLEGPDGVGERYAARFAHVLVDEYQDTNHAQYRMVKALASRHRNLCVVGDDDQCLVEGTPITLPDGSRVPIESLRAGDLVLSGYGRGDFRPARVTRTVETVGRRDGIEILTASGRRLVSTPEHTHFAGYRPGAPPRSRVGSRRQLRLTLCAERRGARPMHGIRMVGNDDAGRDQLAALGLSVRTTGQDPQGWRFETPRADSAALLDVAEQVQEAVGASVVRMARLGRGRERGSDSLPFMPACAVRPGMVMFDECGDYDRVASVRAVSLSTAVYDLDIEDTHNFIADGIVTHNSIYGWRGADVRNILDFERDFDGVHVVRLEQNYRSTGAILEVANAVITCNQARKPKRLRTEREMGDPIQVVRCADERREAGWVSDEIEALRNGRALNDFAVLYRTNSQSRAFEEAFRRAALPYRIVGGVPFYERREIRDVIAYLRLIVNPSDDAAFQRAVGWPRRGVGQKSLERLAELAAEHDESLSAAAFRAAEADGFSKVARRGLSELAQGLDAVRASLGTATAKESLERCVSTFGLATSLAEEEDGADRLENVSELFATAAAFDRDEVEDGYEEATDLELYLQSVALRSDLDQADFDGEAVTMMTLHNAKGLEFPVVFLGGLEEGLFPLSRALETEGGLEEERRLFYVGVTRAMDRLSLTYADQRWRAGMESHSGPSSFLDELPEEHIQTRLGGAFRSSPRRTWRPPGGGHRSAAPASGSAPATAAPGGSSFSWHRESGRRPGGVAGDLTYDYADSQLPLELAPGVRIMHPRFGPGEVLSVQGFGQEAKADIEFEEVGRKKVLVAYAGLRPT